jgi:hypothetical protein
MAEFQAPRASCGPSRIRVTVFVNKLTNATLGALLLATLAGCQSLRGAASPKAVVAESPAFETAAVATAPAAVLPSLESLVAPSLQAPAAPAAPALCHAQPAAKGFYGFYANDAWQQGNVVLTFDDGPHPTHTPRVLDMLKERELTATFFLVGRAISRDSYPLVQRMIAEGHTLGSHSYSHDVKMTKVSAPEATVNEIRGQHETTAILIDLALMARSGDDFDAMYREVFASDPATWLTGSQIRKDWTTYLEDHQELLVSRGYQGGARPYSVVFSRPPGGGPYVEHDGAAGIALYDRALSELGMMNVMWHGASGDTVPEKRSDYAFLTKNMEKYSKQGGVLLVHDYIRKDALAHSLDAMKSDGGVTVIPMERAVERKYACSSDALGLELATAATPDILTRGLFATGSAPSAPAVALSR